jgi:hypothetical protein
VTYVASFFHLSTTNMPPKASSSLPPTLQMKLRPNHAAAPGKPNMPGPKRSSAVVMAEKQVKQNEKEVKQKALENGIKALSKLEDEMAQQDKEKGLTVNHPPILMKPKVTRKKDNVTVVEGETHQHAEP